MTTTFEQVQQIVVDQLGVDPDLVHDGADLVQDLGADSLDVVQIVLDAEDKFNIEIPDETASEVTTVSDLVALVDKTKG
jgi:acyl carrier protein